MGLIYAEIELINGEDLALARKNIIGEEEVKRIPVKMLVDTGSYMLAINENIQEYLQLPVVERRRAELADGRKIWCDVVSYAEVRFKNRKTVCYAMVLPGDSEPLLGAIPLEGMDVFIDPLRQELLVNPASPDFAMTKIKAKKRVSVAP